MAKLCPTCSAVLPEPSSRAFENFWDGRGKGSKELARKYWKRARLDNRYFNLAEAWDTQVVERGRKRRETGWAEDMRHTSTWINQKGWDDPPLTWVSKQQQDVAPDLVGFWAAQGDEDG